MDQVDIGYHVHTILADTFLFLEDKVLSKEMQCLARKRGGTVAQKNGLKRPPS